MQISGAKIVLGKGSEIEFNIVDDNIDARTFVLEAQTRFMRGEWVRKLKEIWIGG